MNMGFGASAMGLLTFLRYKYLWWPLHPLGLTVAGSRVMDWTWFSIFLAWLVKIAVLHYGGPRMFRALRPFFLGLVLGQFVSGRRVDADRRLHGHDRQHDLRDLSRPRAGIGLTPRGGRPSTARRRSPGPLARSCGRWRGG